MFVCQSINAFIALYFLGTVCFILVCLNVCCTCFLSFFGGGGGSRGGGVGVGGGGVTSFLIILVGGGGGVSDILLIFFFGGGGGGDYGFFSQVCLGFRVCWNFIYWCITFIHSFTQFFSCIWGKCKCWVVCFFCFWATASSSINCFWKILVVLIRAGWCDLMQADLLIWADSAGWEVLTVLDEWKIALVMVLVDVEGENGCGVSICRTVVHLESPQRDLTIQKCCVDCPRPDATKGGLTLFAGLKLNIKRLKVPGCWSSTTKKDAGCADASCAGCCTLAITVEGCVVRRLHNWYGDWLSIWYSE